MQMEWPVSVGQYRVSSTWAILGDHCYERPWTQCSVVLGLGCRGLDLLIAIGEVLELLQYSVQ